MASLLVTQALISTYLSLKPFHLHLSSSKLFLPPISSLKPLFVILWSFKLFLPLLWLFKLFLVHHLHPSSSLYFFQHSSSLSVFAYYSSSPFCLSHHSSPSFCLIYYLTSPGHSSSFFLILYLFKLFLVLHMPSNFFLVLHWAIKIFLPLHPSLKLFLLFLLIIQALHSTSLNQTLSAILLIIQTLLFTSLLIHALCFTFSRHSHSSFYFLSSFTLFILILLSFNLSRLLHLFLWPHYLSLKPSFLLTYH